MGLLTGLGSFASFVIFEIRQTSDCSTHTDRQIDKHTHILNARKQTHTCTHARTRIYGNERIQTHAENQINPKSTRKCRRTVCRYIETKLHAYSQW